LDRRTEQPIVIITDYELIKLAFIRDGDTYVDRDFLIKHFTLFFGIGIIFCLNFKKQYTVFSELVLSLNLYSHLK